MDRVGYRADVSAAGSKNDGRSVDQLMEFGRFLESFARFHQHKCQRWLFLASRCCRAIKRLRWFQHVGVQYDVVSSDAVAYQ